jgi:hypothetical protein
MLLLKNTRQPGLASILQTRQQLQTSSVKPEIKPVVHLHALRILRTQ